MERYSIGQVAKMIGVESHTIRFWVNELEHYIQPEIGAGERRYFNNQQVATLKFVHELINKKGYTLSIIKKNGIRNSYETGITHTELPMSNIELNRNIAVTINRIQNSLRDIIAGL